MEKEKTLFEYAKEYLKKNPQAKEILDLFRVSEKEYIECLKFMPSTTTLLSSLSQASSKVEFNANVSRPNQ